MDAREKLKGLFRKYRATLGSRGGWYIGGKSQADMQRELDEYLARADQLGYSKDQALEILRQEMDGALSFSQAVDHASRLLPYQNEKQG